MTDTRPNPVRIRAMMARGGIAPGQLMSWWSPDTERRVDPLGEADTQDEIRRFLVWLWGYCLDSESAAAPVTHSGDAENEAGTLGPD